MIAPREDFVRAVKIYPGERRELREHVHVMDISTVDRAVERLQQGSAVYVLPVALPAVLEQWEPDAL